MLFLTLSVPTHKSANSFLYALFDILIIYLFQQFCAFWMNERKFEWISSSFFSTFSPIFFQVERKRHIGNDIVNIIFIDGDDSCDFSPNCIKSQFTRILFKWIHCLCLCFSFRVVVFFFFSEVNGFSKKITFSSNLNWLQWMFSLNWLTEHFYSVASHSFNSYWNKFN